MLIICHHLSGTADSVVFYFGLHKIELMLKVIFLIHGTIRITNVTINSSARRQKGLSIYLKR